MEINWEPEDAHRALTRAEGMPSESLKRATIASISAAAQIDIAASLRIIAAEAALAMSGAPLDTDEPDEHEEEEPLVEGDVVQADGDGEAGVIQSFRFTEGEYFAEVEWVDGSFVGLIAVSRLSRLVGDEGEEPELRGDLAESVPTADLIDGAAPERDDLVETSEPVEEEIEADFPDPLEALKAKAAATKKAGSKKGKKS